MSGLQFSPPKAAEDMTIGDVAVLSDQFERLIADHKSSDVADGGRSLFDAHTDLFLKYPQTCYLLIHGRVTGDDVRGYVRGIRDAVLSKASGESTTVHGALAAGSLKTHWSLFAKDNAVASPRQFELVLRAATKDSPTVERLARMEQLSVLLKTIDEDPEAFGIAEKEAKAIGDPKATAPFAAARRLTTNAV